MPVTLNIVESTTELGQEIVEVVVASYSTPGPAGPGVPVGGTDGQVLTKTSASDYATAWEDPTGGAGGGAPDDVDYLVGTASGDLSAEIVVGTSPGGELGGTWASPTVDTTHSGSSHASVQAAAEATAASELATHAADTTSVHGIADTSALALTANHPSNATFNDHSARHENGGADEISLAGLDGTPTDLQTHLDDATAAHAGTAIANTPAGGIAATTVQAAINELDSEKAATSHAHAGEDITSGTVADARIASTITRDSEWQARALTAGNGLAGGGDLSADRTFSVNVDDSSIEINSDTLRVKAGGVTAAMVASDVATQAELDAHTGDTSDAHDASAISFSPAGSIAATDVQAAIEEVASEASGIPTDGWTAGGETWTYASPTTFTIAGVDRTTRFTKGTRIKLTQTTNKYFVVVASSFSTNTTVTITGGTDYTLANAAITDPYYSYVANPQGYPGVFNYTPTLTGSVSNPTLGASPEQFGEFSVLGNICSVAVRIAVGGAGFSNGSGDVQCSVPIAPDSTSATRLMTVGSGFFRDVSLADAHMQAAQILDSTKFFFRGQSASSDSLTYAVPVTWASNDQLGFAGHYRI